jgi:hypothetical protein
MLFCLPYIYFLAKYREYLISCLCEGLTSNLSSIPPHSALAVQRICINGLSIGLSEVPESMTQRISAIVGDMHKVCERNLGPKRHLQVWPPFPLIRSSDPKY